MTSRSRWEVAAAVVTAATAVVALLITLGVIRPLGDKDTDGAAATRSAGASASGDTSTAATRSAGASASSDTSAPACYRDIIKGIPNDRATDLEQGTIQKDFLHKGQPLEEPAVLRLTSNGKHLGAFRFRSVARGQAFLFELFDADCRPLVDYTNEARSDRPMGKVGSNEDLRIRLGDEYFALRLQADAAGYIKLKFI